MGRVSGNLPGFVVLPDSAYPQGGSANWSGGFLPPNFQGTPLRPAGAPILDMEPPPGVDRNIQREELGLLSQINKMHEAPHPEHRELAARLESYELAVRMPAEMPLAID